MKLHLDGSFAAFHNFFLPHSTSDKQLQKPPPAPGEPAREQSPRRQQQFLPEHDGVFEMKSKKDISCQMKSLNGLLCR